MNGDGSVAPTLAEHKPGDTWCDDGWGIYTNASRVTHLARVARQHELLFDYWCGCPSNLPLLVLCRSFLTEIACVARPAVAGIL